MQNSEVEQFREFFRTKDPGTVISLLEWYAEEALEEAYMRSLDDNVNSEFLQKVLSYEASRPNNSSPMFELSNRVKIRVLGRRINKLSIPG